MKPPRVIHRGPYPVPIDERVWPRVDKNQIGGCWRWTGTLHGAGYGLVSYRRRNIRVHRWIYEQLRGPIPSHLQCDHLCRNRWCVNPDHIELVTMKENIRRGISPAALNALKTHCHVGHVFDITNTGRDEHGDRYCRACARASSAKYITRVRSENDRRINYAISSWRYA